MEFEAPQKLKADRNNNLARQYAVTIVSELDRYIPSDRRRALRLGKALGTSPQLWLNLQNDYDLQVAQRGIRRQLEKIELVIAEHDAA
jgi:hypothetical protein